MGLGHFGGGAAVARWLARQGAIVTVTDLAHEHTLAPALATLQAEPIAAYHLGGHWEEDFRQAELVVVNPAVRPGDRFLRVAAAAGAARTSEIELFLNACPASVIGVTGSNGKSTTAAMTAAILRAEGRRTWLGGNLGASLLEQLEQIDAGDWVVLELSSFQLAHLNPGARLPELAVVVNCTPNHLDWHGRFEDYVAAKQRILTGQKADALAVLNTRDAEVSRWGRLVRGRQLALLPPAAIPPLQTPGEHNRANALCAATAAAGVGCSADAIRRGLGAFSGLPQRLEWFAVLGGRRFYNDSTATTPESTIAALETLEGGVWLLAGGSDKGIDLRPLAAAVVRRARGAAFFGAVRQRLRELALASRPNFPCVALETLAEALRWCWQQSGPGESVVLSPACASYDQFQNFRQRGEVFAELVRRLSSGP